MSTNVQPPGSFAGDAPMCSFHVVLRMMPVYRLVALDIDGTLLTSTHHLTPRVCEAVRAVRRRGVQVCLATGKLFGAIQPMLTTLDVSGPQIVCNGAAIVDAATGRFEATWTLGALDLMLARGVLAELAPDLPIAWYTADAIYTDAPPGPLDDILQAYHEPPLRHVAQLDEALPPPTKLLISAPPERLTHLRERSEDELHGALRVVRTSADFLEYMRLDVNKGEALRSILATLQIAPAEVVAIGDGENDLPLLEVAGLAVAMGNAVPALAAHAHRRTGTSDEDGVAQVLEDLDRLGQLA